MKNWREELIIAQEGTINGYTISWDENRDSFKVESENEGMHFETIEECADFIQSTF